MTLEQIAVIALECDMPVRDVAEIVERDFDDASPSDVIGFLAATIDRYTRLKGREA